MLLITGAIKTTPTVALEIIANISSLYILVESEAIMENYRAETSEIPEIRRLTDLVLKENYKNQEVLNITFNDKMKSRLSKGKS